MELFSLLVLLAAIFLAGVYLIGNLDEDNSTRPIVPTHPGSVLTDYKYKYKTPVRVGMDTFKMAKAILKGGYSVDQTARSLNLHPNTVRLIKKSRSLKQYRELRRKQSKPEVYK